LKTSAEPKPGWFGLEPAKRPPKKSGPAYRLDLLREREEFEADLARRAERLALELRQDVDTLRAHLRAITKAKPRGFEKLARALASAVDCIELQLRDPEKLVLAADMADIFAADGLDRDGRPMR
jgi:hypothetical protein